ncbi:MAG: monovalent cation/H+ antiporter subunit D family protein, partial [Aquisalinus sp.]|nr:monovalent cation/H+ antiporter subunit D family protein [Aquisalinus sp.]
MFSLVSHNMAVYLALIVPVFGFLGIMMADRHPNIREGVTLITGVITFYMALTIFAAVGQGAQPGFEFLEIMPGLKLSFQVEPLGAMFGLIASGLWIINSLYSIGYMRGTNEKSQTRFYMCFAIAIMAALGIAYAANLLTFFLFYEILTLSTFPLVTHKENAAARKGGSIYLGILLGTSIGLFLPAIILTWVLTGTTEFSLGGILAERLDANSGVVMVLLLLFAFGIGKAALMPIHPWLPNAMVAPTPVSAFLHAVAVVKAGVFGVLKVAVYIFGIDFLSAGSASDVVMWLAAFSILAASAIAMTQDNLKARLAYSTVGQLSYVTLGAMLATSMGVMGGATQIAAHAVGKMTLFMCAGAIYVSLHKSLISDMRGTGWKMPVTWTVYIIGACSIIGLPPMAGSWPKFFLMLSSVDAGHLMLIGVLILSSLMNIVYLLA